MISSVPALLARMARWTGVAVFCATVCHAEATAPSREEPPLARLASLPEAVATAMRANVVVEREAPSYSIASGVVVLLRDGVAWIATARHAVDAAYSSSLRGDALEAAPGARILITTIDRQQAHAEVLWLAPHGIDLALVSARVSGQEVREARRDRKDPLKGGEPVYTIGNPAGRPWQQTTGGLLQVRDHEQEGFAFQVFQTALAMAPGDSGGGLYDLEGRLVGINSQGGIRDPRFPGGLGLSISLQALVELAPGELGLSDRTRPQRNESPN